MRNLLIYYILCFLALCSCSDSHTSIVLDEAEALYDKALYEEADSVLRTIDGIALKPGSEQQARYALLVTKTDYKNNAAFLNDSLISIAVEFYESTGSKEGAFYAYLYKGIALCLIGELNNASSALLKATNYIESIDDAYSKGQLYGYLSYVNSLMLCTDDEVYARKSYDEYAKGGLDNYALNALTMISLSKLHTQDYDSCRIVIDSCISKCYELGQNQTLGEALSIKLQYAIVLDSIDLADKITQEMKNLEPYQTTLMDYTNHAIMYAHKQKSDSVRLCLSYAQQLMYNSHDTIQYWTKSYWAYRILHQDSLGMLYQDSLFHYQEDLLSEGLKHTALASQRDYAEWRRIMAEEKTHHRNVVFILSTSVFITLIALLVSTIKKKAALIKLQSEKIARLLTENNLHKQEIAIGLLKIQSDELIPMLQIAADQKKGLTLSEWNKLNQLFRNHIPYFETSLRKYVNLSDTEWYVCMLLKLNFSPGEIAILTNKTLGGISSIRSRLYQKCFKRKGSAPDWDLFISSL